MKDTAIQEHEVKTLGQLVDSIGAGVSPELRGPVVKQIKVWDGRVVTGTYSDKPEDVYTEEIIFIETDELMNLIKQLLENGKSFVASMDCGELTIEWTIR